MGILTFIVCLFLLLINYKQDKKGILSPAILFYALWSFILLLSNLQLYNITKPSNEAYFLILLMLIFFYIGKWLAYGVIKKNHQKFAEVNINPKFKIIYFLIFLVIIFTLIDCFIIVKNLKLGIPLSEMRRWRMGAFGIDNNPMLARRTFVEEAFRSIVLAPFETIIPPLAAYYLFSPEKYKKRFLLLALSLLVLLLSSIAGGGGRLGYIYYIGSFLSSALLFSKKSNINLKKYISIFLCLGIFAIFIFTSIRTDVGLIKQTYTYFALPPTLLSIWLPKIKEAAPLFGMLTFFGVHSYIFRIFGTLGLNFLVPNAYNLSYNWLLNAEKFVNTGYGVGNAFVTPIYYFFIDGGYPFVIMASTFFGFLIFKFYKKHNINNVQSFIFYILIMYGVFLSFMRIQTSIPSYIISFILVSFLLKSDKRSSQNEK